MKGSFRLAAVMLAATTLSAAAAEVAVAPKKLVIVDKTALVGSAKIVFVAKDPGVTKGPGIDPALIDAEFDLSYVGTGSVTGSFLVPAGLSNGTDGWKVNKATVAKYVNKAAPGGPTGAKVLVVKPGKLLKIVGKSRGDVPIDIVAAGAPGSGIETRFTVTNDGVTTDHCSIFPTCTHKVISGGTGAKLVCKNGIGSVCPVPPTTTTSSTTTSSTTTTSTTSTSSSTSSSSTTSTSTSTSTAPSCVDGIENGAETDIDCGGGTCPACGPGDGCVVAADCTSSVCLGFVCQAPSCADGVQNGLETDVDCGGPGCPDCSLGDTCNSGADCVSGSCNGGVCRCPATNHTFSINSNNGGVFDSAEWPGGTQIFNATSECNVTIKNPGDNIDLVCTLGGGGFAVIGATGFSACFGTGGEDGDGCQPVSCPPLGVGSCCSTRPSCSAALNGSGSAQYFVHCNP